jgi:acetyl esterase/lipase
MKYALRLWTLLTAWLAVLANVRLPNGRFFWLFAVCKVLAGPLSPFLVAAGTLGALLGLLRRDWLASLAGIIAAVAAREHIRKVTAAHEEFTFAFGADWPQRIPHHLQWRLRPRRYLARPLTSPAVPVAWNYVIGSHYETGDPLLADVWQPPNDVPHTGIGIIYLHGSAWHYTDKDFYRATRPFFQYLANQGHVIADVAYTLSPKAGLIPMVADVKRAIAWMKINAADLGIQPERIVLMGGSAGAHLALLAAYTPNHPILDPADVMGVGTAVHGVISFYGVSEAIGAYENLARLPLMPARLTDVMERLMLRSRMLPAGGRYVDGIHVIPYLLGGLPDAEPEMYALASPLAHVGRHCPPTLLINGTHDLAIHVSQHRQLHAALYRQHIPCVHVELDCADHAFDLIAPRWSPANQAALYDIERFLALLI